MKKLLLISFFQLLLVLSISAQVAGSGKAAVFINNKSNQEVKQNEALSVESKNVQSIAGNNKLVGGGKFYALIIGINNYSDPLINELDNPIKDAELFYQTIISRYTFEEENVKLLKNATMSDIVTALDFYVQTVRTSDNFLVFYAGHGVWNPAAEIGFWLPSDARKNSTLNWFRNSTLRDYLREINSKHTLLISDACFGGSILKPRAVFPDAPLAINKLYDLPSRKAMTSGTLTEVPDQSTFLRYMIERLDNNNEKYLSSEQLFSSFRIAVINNSNVVPQFGEIKDVGDEGGDFIFILK